MEDRIPLFVDACEVTPPQSLDNKVATLGKIRKVEYVNRGGTQDTNYYAIEIRNKLGSRETHKLVLSSLEYERLREVYCAGNSDDLLGKPIIGVFNDKQEVLVGFIPVNLDR